jgi:hypothetical protein
MTSHPFDLVSLDMAGTTVDEGGLVQEQTVEASGPPQACPGPLGPGPPRAGEATVFVRARPCGLTQASNITGHCCADNSSATSTAISIVRTASGDWVRPAGQCR